MTALPGDGRPGQGTDSIPSPIPEALRFLDSEMHLPCLPGTAGPSTIETLLSRTPTTCHHNHLQGDSAHSHHGVAASSGFLLTALKATQTELIELRRKYDEEAASK